MMGSRVILVSVVAAALFSGCYGGGNDVTPTAVGATATGTPIPTPIAEPSSASQATPAHPLPGLESRAGLDHLLICVDVSPAAIPAMRATEAAALVTASLPSYARLYGLANDAFRDAGAQPHVRRGDDSLVRAALADSHSSDSRLRHRGRNRDNADPSLSVRAPGPCAEVPGHPAIVR